MKKYNLMLLLIIICSCKTTPSDYGSYKFDFQSAMDHYIMFDKIDTVLQNYPYYNKGSFLYFHNPDSTVDTFFMGKGGYVIEPYVDDVKFNNRFILVKQKPLDEICECNDSCRSKKYPANRKTYELCKQALQKSAFFQYWVIDKADDNIYGPFSLEMLYKQMYKLKIPENLKF